MMEAVAAAATASATTTAAEAKKSETINGKDTKMCSKQEIPKRKRKSEQNKDACEGVKNDVLLRFR